MLYPIFTLTNHRWTNRIRFGIKRRWFRNELVVEREMLYDKVEEPSGRLHEIRRGWRELSINDVMQLKEFSLDQVISNDEKERIG